MGVATQTKMRETTKRVTAILSLLMTTLKQMVTQTAKTEMTTAPHRSCFPVHMAQNMVRLQPTSLCLPQRAIGFFQKDAPLTMGISSLSKTPLSPPLSIFGLQIYL